MVIVIQHIVRIGDIDGVVRVFQGGDEVLDYFLRHIKTGDSGGGDWAWVLLTQSILSRSNLNKEFDQYEPLNRREKTEVPCVSIHTLLA